MQFNTFIFVLLFFPVSVAGYHLLNRVSARAGKFFLIAAGAVFYAFGGAKAGIILAADIVVNYVCARAIERYDEYKKPLLLAGVAVNVLLLFMFKYLDFTIISIGSLLGTEVRTFDLMLPLGISFYTFQQIMYISSVYRKDIKKVVLSDYLFYVLYFPKIMMGPLCEPKDLIAKINDPALKGADWDNILSGIKIFSFGLFKKVILADTFARAVAWGNWKGDIAGTLDIIIVMLSCTFQIYFDFSGYTDMAVGVSRMFNIELPMNFDSPYKALSVRDFWKRWHMTLTAFLTKYIYIPLGGNRKGKARTYLNVMAVFIISGLWHGASWTFVLWGVLHGVLTVLDRITEGVQKKIFPVIRWFVTFVYVNILWLLFGSESVRNWLAMLSRLFSFEGMTADPELREIFAGPVIKYGLSLFAGDLADDLAGLWGWRIIIAASFIICLLPEHTHRNIKKNTVPVLAAALIAFIFGFLSISGEAVFIYNGF